MQEFFIEIKRTLVQMSLWGAFVLCCMYLSQSAFLMSGFVLGFLTSLIYYLLTCYRIKKCIDLPLAKAVAYMRIGWAMRLVFVVLMLGLSIHTPQLNFWGAVAGMFSLHAVMLFNAVFIIVKGSALDEHDF